VRSNLALHLEFLRSASTRNICNFRIDQTAPAVDQRTSPMRPVQQAARAWTTTPSLFSSTSRRGASPARCSITTIPPRAASTFGRRRRGLKVNAWCCSPAHRPPTSAKATAPARPHRRRQRCSRDAKTGVGGAPPATPTPATAALLPQRPHRRQRSCSLGVPTGDGGDAPAVPPPATRVWNPTPSISFLASVKKYGRRKLGDDVRENENAWL
jgi:hypothetical protein